ncbi:MAG: hypothetical protein PHY87_00070 [Sphaerochaeta sp.]|uniref:hypothetical protein n=1 Tax=Sphaerochaeta sp. TaxID=1972642 RepID=UPI0029717C2B|nr:hypothetical protein [uncultured Sphaerochaeta sp.]MDD3057805.1 hypothetical protein [Sphaerochaeta sp.]MDD3928175.1 hypothetical protein [Sphaerochaeta sp.]
MDSNIRLCSFQRFVSSPARAVRPGAVCVLFLCLCLYPLHPAIILETAPTDVVFEIQPIPDQDEQIQTRLPICDLTLHAKHRGLGRLFFDHTPLSLGNQVVSYLLEDEQGRLLERSIPFEYQVHGIFHEQVRMGRLYARLFRPLSQNQGAFRSTISIHFILEQ